MKIKMELVSKLSNPFSSTLMYKGFEYINKRKKPTDLARKLEKV